MRAIIFILLKIVEVAAFIFGPYLIGNLYYAIINADNKTTCEAWGCGCIIIIAILVLLAVGIGLICANLDLSKKITKEIKNRTA